MWKRYRDTLVECINVIGHPCKVQRYQKISRFESLLRHLVWIPQRYRKVKFFLRILKILFSAYLEIASIQHIEKPLSRFWSWSFLSSMISGKDFKEIILIISFRNNNREYENKKFDLRARKDIFSVDDLPQVWTSIGWTKLEWLRESFWGLLRLG